MNWKFGISGCFVLVFFIACKKDHEIPKTIKPSFLSVKLNSPYLGPSQIDSAFAAWTSQGKEYKLKLSISNDSLIAPLEKFAEGEGELVIHIYANKKYSNQYPGQWLWKKNINLLKTKAVSLKGPESFYDNDWLPRVELSDAIGHKAVIALRPDDPFFLVKDPGHPLYSLTVDRSYWKTRQGIALAGRDIWRCTQSCTELPEEEFFRSLPGRIGDKPWNHISIAILFEINHEGEGWVLSLEYEP